MLRAVVDSISASLSARAGVLGLTYFGGAELGHVLSIKTQDQIVAPIWPPAGLLLAALVQSQFRSWPALLLAACAANLASDVLLHDRSVPASLGFCVSNSGEACLGAWLLRRFAGMPFTLARMKDVLALGCLSALFSTMFGAMIGAGIVQVACGASYWSAWHIWWMADTVGVVAVAPVVLTLTALSGAYSEGVRPWRMVEGMVLFAGMMVVTEGVYGELLPSPLNAPVFVLPFLLWAALRFGPSCAAAAVLVAALIGVWNMSHGLGLYPLLTTVPGPQLLRVQGTLFAISLSVLALAVTVAERKQVEQQRIKLIGELERALNDIKTLRGLIPLCAWCKKIRHDQGHWQLLEDYLHAHTEAEITHGICPECLAKQVAAMTGADPERREG